MSRQDTVSSFFVCHNPMCLPPVGGVYPQARKLLVSLARLDTRRPLSFPGGKHGN